MINYIQNSTKYDIICLEKALVQACEQVFVLAFLCVGGNMEKNFESPSYEKKAFTCPNCSAFSKHDWDYCYIESDGRFSLFESNVKERNKLSICRCENCGYLSFWYEEKLCWPLNTGIMAPPDEMPDDIKRLYNEASSIVELSPKGSCAILRLALQKLCNRLAGQEEKNKIDAAIKKLVENGLPTSLQKAMDTVRIVGNDAVHPGEINIDDNKQLAIAMFELMNIIIEKMIIEPKRIDELYNLMPQEKLQGIQKRDKKNNQEKIKVTN